MKAILRRELVAYFTSPIVYVYLAIFTFFSGLFFTVGCLSAKTTNMASVYDSMFVVFLVIIPILTMRLFSEEKKQRTDQGLLTGGAGRAFECEPSSGEQVGKRAFLSGYGKSAGAGSSL